jgi:hypothetical protein
MAQQSGMGNMTLGKWSILPILALAIVTVANSSSAYAEEKAQMVRLSKLVVDPSHREAYQSALREEVSASVRDFDGMLGYNVFAKHVVCLHYGRKEVLFRWTRQAQ